MNWLKLIWSNKFVRDRIFAFAFLIAMFAGFWHAYHANSDFHKLVGLVPGVISLVAIFVLVYDDFDPKDPKSQTGGRFGENLKDEEDKDENVTDDNDGNDSSHK